MPKIEILSTYIITGEYPNENKINKNDTGRKFNKEMRVLYTAILPSAAIAAP